MNLQTQTEQDAAKLAQLVHTTMKNMVTPVYLDLMRHFALDLRLKFVALLEAGFTEAQALQIVIERKP